MYSIIKCCQIQGLLRPIKKINNSIFLILVLITPKAKLTLTASSSLFRAIASYSLDGSCLCLFLAANFCNVEDNLISLFMKNGFCSLHRLFARYTGYLLATVHQSRLGSDFARCCPSVQVWILLAVIQIPKIGSDFARCCPGFAQQYSKTVLLSQELFIWTMYKVKSILGDEEKSALYDNTSLVIDNIISWSVLQHMIKIIFDKSI
ncbi:hypothetical protein KSP39_PZI008784 [Platanthera zijinensis]|uniref:Uncharacterized protein n=1 Tax=Platanthera zijinensis TaxID=2320716 RepID=A0AAP0G8A5_9ASPA